MFNIGCHSPRTLVRVTPLLLCLAACGNNDDRADTRATIGQPQPAAVIGTTAPDSNKIPADFPGDIPIYPGLTVLSVNSVPDQDIFNLQGKTYDSLEQVKGFIASATVNKGWDLVSEADTGGMMYSFQFKKGARQLAYMLMNNNGTNVSMNVRKLNP